MTAGLLPDSITRKGKFGEKGLAKKTTPPHPHPPPNTPHHHSSFKEGGILGNEEGDYGPLPPVGGKKSIGPRETRFAALSMSDFLSRGTSKVKSDLKLVFIDSGVLFPQGMGVYLGGYSCLASS